MTVTIVRIEPTSRTSSEATLILDDRTHQCLAFEQPCVSRVGTIVTGPLLAFEAREIERDDSGPLGFFPDDSPLGCVVRGDVTAHSGPMVAVGGFVIELDMPLPKDIGEGEQIRFRCTRLDHVA